ncbi:hypothetical protein [Allosphingosinicella indica]|uniref:Uncharacterized protein n=1 Tax=Allosphingosinicella indica TaxID=941907 RepID=A0A1X7GGW9_9SPHN|nr:hypothetical protein [Allosphingosinicella indica]SMF69488.1 hypothetical protein SAMN06295910_1735 [Allosphingosinicella indica]
MSPTPPNAQSVMKRRVLPIAGTAIKAALFLVGLFTVAQYALFWLIGVSASTGVLKRLPSPDGALTAYLLQKNPGAMSSYVYVVVLTPAGQGHGDGRTLISGARLEGLDFRWTDARSLAVKVPCGLYSDATNFFGDGSRDLWVKVEFDVPKCSLRMP